MTHRKRQHGHIRTLLKADTRAKERERKIAFAKDDNAKPTIPSEYPPELRQTRAPKNGEGE